ncbi:MULTISPECIES: Re/Si-specific NAD(P)(+) transhydrogenase subunit alpha [Prochlorococcus]|uniref:Re/Si-specific NAD(P)(+) transhydrogenase subunit alpha n=1 Tax=Prochlorococcus TaxID=1218 RepID=UPI000533B6A5|nr:MULTISPECIES: Re/Si-specific NAD(P)(+) transhydrogenase subunit alpha [Prochlorococcus]KGG12127.1 NAD(P) transhydrogenase alpha subunit [Prochlorococcus sp. MIT 0601]
MPSLLIPLDSVPGETRVAATPETVKKFLDLGCTVCVQQGAGVLAGFSDENYMKAGAEVVSLEESNLFITIDLVLCVNTPQLEFLSKLKSKTLIVGLLSPYGNLDLGESLKVNELSALALELLPRISRAQSSDALSSQANIAGYKSVLLAASALDRYFPMLMTAAGTVQPAKVVVLGAGVAGLQAVATAKRLGAVVYVSDIRPAVKEQVESLGARFIAPPEIEDSPSESAGYARQASEAFLNAQRKQLKEQLSEADVAICTAQVPGKKAPRLLNEEMLDGMRPGSVVIDLAVAQGGNCAGTKPGETIVRKGVNLIGASNLPSSVPNHASVLYSRNLFSLIHPFLKDGNLLLDTNDELINGSLISHNGFLRHEAVFNSGEKI